MKVKIFGLLMTIALGALLAAPSYAFTLQDPILKQKGIEYAITGVAESKQDPRWQDARRFPLKLEFATARGELYSDVDVRIYTMDQKLVLNVRVNAPWLMVGLKAGTYNVYVQGPSKKSTVVTITPGQQVYKTFKW